MAYILIRSVSSWKVRTPEVALYASRLWTSDGRLASGDGSMERWIDGCEIINRILRGAIGAIGIDIYIRYFENVWYAFFICIFGKRYIYMIYMICILGYMGLWKDSHHRHMCQFFEMFISRLAPWLHGNSSQPNQMVPWFWRNHWPVWPVFCSIFVDWEGFCQLWWSCSRPRKMFQWCSMKVSFVSFSCWLPEVFHSRRLTGRLVMKFSKKTRILEVKRPANRWLEFHLFLGDIMVISSISSSSLT